MTFAPNGHQSPLGCGWVAKDKPCSKEEQYELREKAALNLAIGALATKKLSMMEMMQAVDGVPKSCVVGWRCMGRYHRHVSRDCGMD